MATQQRTERTRTVEREAQRPVTSLIEDILTETEAQRVLAPLLPRGVPMSRITAAVELERRKNTALGKCSPESLVDAVSRALRWGLDIGEDVYIVPKAGKAIAIADYKGLAKLMVVSGAARSVQAFCVFEGEHFRYEQGLNPVLEHHPYTDYDPKRAIVGAYVIIRRPFNNVTFDFMPIGEIEAIRATSHQWKGERTCPPWYAAKSIIRRASKLMPKDPKYAKYFNALAEDEAQEFDAAEQLAAVDAIADGQQEPERHGGIVPIVSADRATENAYGDGTDIGKARIAGGEVASEAQIERLLDLSEHPAVAQAKDKIRNRIERGTLTREVADAWIADVERAIAAAEGPAESDELELGDRRAAPRDALREGH